MRNAVYAQFEYARKKKDLKVMEDLYFQNPKDEQIKFGYAKLLVEKGYVSEGKELLFELLGSKNNIYACLELGKALAFEGNYEEAKKYFTKLSDIGDRYGKLELGVLESRAGNYEIAREIFNELIEWYNDERAKVELARLDHKDGKSKVASNSLRELSVGEKGYIAMYSLGIIEKERGNLDKAKKIFLSLLDKPNSVKAKFEIAKIETMFGDINLARFYFQNLIGTVKDSYARLELGRLETRVENYDRAREILTELYNDEKSDEAKLELGILEANAGNTDKARKHFRELITKRNGEYAKRLLLLLEVKEQNDLEAIKIAREMLASGSEVNLHIILYLSSKYNIFFEKFDYSNIVYKYISNQILDYNFEEAIRHVTINHGYEQCKSRFEKGIDIKSLFFIAEQELNCENKLKRLHFNDEYIIPYKNIGSAGQNYIKVITLPHSKNIITMYPTFDRFEVSNSDEELDYYKHFAQKRISIK